MKKLGYAIVTVFDKKEIIGKTRKTQGLTREDLSDGICDVSSLKRYEKGTINPPDDKYYDLLKKMGKNGNRYVLPCEMGLFINKHIYDEFELLLNKHDYFVINERLEKIKSGMNEDFTVEYEQFVERIRLLNVREKEHKECHGALEILLQKSIKDYKIGKFPTDLMINETELHILNDIGIALWQSGKWEMAIEHYEKLDKYFMNAECVDDSIIYIKVLINYSNCLGQAKQYKKSIEICRKGIWQSQKNKTQNQIHTFLFNIGWNYYYMYLDSRDEDYKNRAECYVKAALTLCKKMNESGLVLEEMSNFYNSVLIHS